MKLIKPKSKNIESRFMSNSLAYHLMNLLNNSFEYLEDPLQYKIPKNKHIQV